MGDQEKEKTERFIAVCITVGVVAAIIGALVFINGAQGCSLEHKRLKYNRDIQLEAIKSKQQATLLPDPFEERHTYDKHCAHSSHRPEPEPECCRLIFDGTNSANLAQHMEELRIHKLEHHKETKP